jgi:subtilase family serine protease
MLLLLAPPSARQQALTLKLASLQNPSSPDYHHWLTASAFADSYGNSAADVAQVTAWLRGAGFEVAPLPAGRGWIEFSGTVSQVELAFGAQIHSIASGSATRAVIAGSIRIPAGLRPRVTGLVSLDGSLATVALTPAEPMSLSATEMAAETSVTAAPALTPQLVARLLHFDSLQAAGTAGTGQTIAIAARSNVRSEDVAAFRATFGLPANPLAVSLNSSDPGRNADEPAAVLLASWAGAAAPGARILLVPAATTAATDGLDLSLAAVIDQAQANVVAIGYSECEAALSPAHQAFYAALYRQAAAQGISIVSATGDSGAAACQAAGSGDAVTSGYAVNALAATPWNTAIGVAAFADRGAPTFSAWAPVNPADPAFAGGGGASAVQALPAWQPTPSSRNASSEAAGLFSGHRLLPDIAMPTAIDAGLNPGLAFCLGGASGSCTLVRSGGSGAATALAAGIAALIDQKDGAQGNLAPNLYRLANTAGVYADVTEGGAQLRCETGTPGCSDEGQIGFAAAPGYDLATGLGVVNAQVLATNWAKPQTTGTNTVTVVLTTSAQTLNPSGTLTLSATVQGSSSVGNPTGTVVFVDTTTGVQLASVSPLTASGTDSATATTTVTATTSNQLEVVESHVIAAQYGGDSNYGGDQSPSVTVTVALSPTTVAITPASTSVLTGNSLAVQAVITASIPGSVSPTGTVTFNVDGNSQGTGTLVAGSTSATATTSVNLTGLTVGTHTLQGYYAGDKNYNNAYSPSVGITVTKGATTITLVASQSNPTAGSPITFTATVAPTASTSGAAAITGTVTFFDGSTPLGNPATIANGVATLSGVTLSASTTHSITAVYAGDANWAGSTSNILSITVTMGVTVTTLTATPSALTAGSASTSVILSAAIAPSTTVASVTITGTVKFYDGTTLLGSAAVASNAASLTVLLSNSVDHSITAIYSGDANWLPSTSMALALPSPLLPDTVTLTANPTNPTPGQAVILTATVTPIALPAATAEQYPTGMVTFYAGTTAIGTALLAPSTSATSLDSAVATLTISTLPGGTDQVTAVYSGDLTYKLETSNVLILTIQNFTITPAASNPATNLNIVQGGAGSVAYVITGTGGFNGLVQVVCSVPTQDDMTCTATPQDVAPPATVTFVVQTFTTGTTPPTSTASLSRPWRPGGRARSVARVASETALALLGFLLLPFGRRARIFIRSESARKTRRLLVLLLMLGCFAGMGLGCSTSKEVLASGTPLGVATLTITASANVDNTVVSQSVYLTVNVTAPGTTAQ